MPLCNKKWKDWKSNCPVYIGNFEKATWHIGDESEESTVSVVACRGCNDWELSEIMREVKRVGADKDAVVDIDDCLLADDGAEELAKALRGKTSVTELLLSDNNLTEEGAAALVDTMSGIPVRRVDWAFNMLGDNGMNSIVAMMGNTLLHLNLRDNEIEVDGATILAQAFSGGAAPRLLSLNLRQNQILSAGALEICNSLQGHGSITALDLRENSIRAEGAEGIAQLVASTSTLKYLAICRNATANEGAALLGDSLRSNKSLTELWMQDSHIENPGGEALSNAITGHKNIKKFDLKGNLMDRDFMKAIGQVCSKNRQR